MYNFSTPVTKDITLVAQFEKAYDPANPKLSDLKAVLATSNPASIYPVGTEIPDTYNGSNNPLIVAQYLNSSNNSAYGGVEGVILIRKYANPNSYRFSYETSNYDGSTIKTFLNNEYFNNCSDTIKSIISPIAIPYIEGKSYDNKWFLMSATEVMGIYRDAKGNTLVEGIGWDYWKARTGLTTASNDTNAGRIVSDGGAATIVWLRSQYNANSVYSIREDGLVYYGYSYNTGLGVLPACFVSKN